MRQLAFSVLLLVVSHVSAADTQYVIAAKPIFYPTYLYCDTNGDLLISGYDNKNGAHGDISGLYRWTPGAADGTKVNSLGGSNRNPIGMIIGSDGNYYLSHSRYIFKCVPNGACEQIINVPGGTGCYGLGFVSGTLDIKFISMDHHKVHRWNKGADGTYSFGEEWGGRSEMNRPRGGAIFPDGSYVASNYGGANMMKYDNVSGSAGVEIPMGIDVCKSPSGVKIDDAGRIYVACLGTSRIMRFTVGQSAGEILYETPRSNAICDMCWDKYGNLFVENRASEQITRKCETAECPQLDTITTTTTVSPNVNINHLPNPRVGTAALTYPYDNTIGVVNTDVYGQTWKFLRHRVNCEESVPSRPAMDYPNAKNIWGFGAFTASYQPYACAAFIRSLRNRWDMHGALFMFAGTNQGVCRACRHPGIDNATGAFTGPATCTDGPGHSVVPGTTYLWGNFDLGENLVEPGWTYMKWSSTRSSAGAKINLDGHYEREAGGENWYVDAVSDVDFVGPVQIRFVIPQARDEDVWIALKNRLCAPDEVFGAYQGARNTAGCWQMRFHGYGHNLFMNGLITYVRDFTKPNEPFDTLGYGHIENGLCYWNGHCEAGSIYDEHKMPTELTVAANSKIPTSGPQAGMTGADHKTQNAWTPIGYRRFTPRLRPGEPMMLEVLADNTVAYWRAGYYRYKSQIANGETIELPFMFSVNMKLWVSAGNIEWKGTAGAVPKLPPVDPQEGATGTRCLQSFNLGAAPTGSWTMATCNAAVRAKGMADGCGGYTNFHPTAGLCWCGTDSCHSTNADPGWVVYQNIDFGTELVHRGHFCSIPGTANFNHVLFSGVTYLNCTRSLRKRFAPTGDDADGCSKVGYSYGRGKKDGTDYRGTCACERPSGGNALNADGTCPGYEDVSASNYPWDAYKFVTVPTNLMHYAKTSGTVMYGRLARRSVRFPGQEGSITVIAGLTIMQCRQQCADIQCKSFDFEPSTGNCFMGPDSVATAGAATVEAAYDHYEPAVPAGAGGDPHVTNVFGAKF